MSTDTTVKTTSEKKENMLVNLAFNIIIPAIILSKFSKEQYFGPVYGLIVALAFPLVYGLYDLLIRKKRNFVSILGFVSILLTGIIGIMHFPPQWIAVKEAIIPFLIGAAVLISMKTSFPLVKKIIYNKEMLDIEKIDAILDENQSAGQFESMMQKASLMLAGSFFISSALNYMLAKILVHSAPGTEQFNTELGKMAVLSYPVIALPSMLVMGLVFWYIFRSLRQLTGLPTEELFSEKLRNK